MLPGSHVVPINDSALKSLHSPKLLADAFSEFISASSLLESSYRDLQHEVGHLGTELAERNAALTGSLAENEAMRGALQQIIDSMPCCVLVLDTAEMIVTINPEGRRLLRLGTAQVWTLRDIARISEINLEALAQRSEVRGSEGRLEHEVCVAAAGKKRWVAISNRKLSGACPRPVAGSGKKALQSIWILRDMTANKEAEQEREAARNALALAEVSAILAHEIRNPLASMELFAGLLAEDREQTGLWVSHLRAGIRLLSATVNNVLSLQGGSSSHLLPVELLACVRSGVEFVQPIAEQAGVTLTFRGEGGFRIQGDENQIRQILLNLICNAIRHTSAGGKVTVTAHGVARDGNLRALVDVRDTGCGIAEQQIERVFETGFSAQGDTPGLGLAVCKRLMTLHGGEIRVSSQVRCGTTFQLEFPTL
jgi:two-component system sensor histidine kinase FlrB